MAIEVPKSSNFQLARLVFIVFQVIYSFVLGLAFIGLIVATVGMPAVVETAAYDCHREGKSDCDKQAAFAEAGFTILLSVAWAFFVLAIINVILSWLAITTYNHCAMVTVIVLDVIGCIIGLISIFHGRPGSGMVSFLLSFLELVTIWYIYRQVTKHNPEQFMYA